MILPIDIEHALKDFDNASDCVFTRIDSEEWRRYTFATGGTVICVTIQAPIYLSVSESGGHRVFDAAQQSHYIPSGWVHLEWKARDGQPHFVK